jgi:hypothetical protein
MKGLGAPERRKQKILFKKCRVPAGIQLSGHESF